MKMTSVFAPITRTVENDDGTMYVYGKATGPDLDLDYQRCDPQWLKTAMPEWFGVGGVGPFSTGGNIREQHDAKKAAGRAVDHEELEDGHYIKAHIVDPVAVMKTQHGVYTGFSIGIGQPRVEKSTSAPNGIIKDGKIFEVSLVDRPALPSAIFRMCKAAKPGMEIASGDFDSQRMLVKCGDFIEKAADEVPSMTVTIGESMTEEQKAKFDSLYDAQDSEEKALDSLLPPAGSGTEFYKTEMTRADAIGFTVTQKASNMASAEMPPEYDSEQVDIENAQEAICILSQLIISEASEMADNPAEDCDISILLDAVAALRHFICREQQQAMGADVVKKPIPIFLAADPDLIKAKYSAEQLRQLLKEGKAMRNPNGDPSYPIADKADLSNAIHAVGRGSGDHNSIRAYIKRRAKALGASNMIPDNWTNGGSDKAVEPDEVKTVETDEGSPVIEKVAGGLTTLPDSETAPPEAAKAASVDEESGMDAIFKAFSDENHPFFKHFSAIVEKSTAQTAAQLGELGERLGRVEEMAKPGGPSLKRTEVERDQARKLDLTAEVVRYKALASNAEDRTLRKGYEMKAAALEAEIKTL